MKKIVRAAACALALAPICGLACGGSIIDVSDAADASEECQCIDQNVPFACGTTECQGDEVCVHPCCGGIMICEAVADGGLCPSGLVMSLSCPTDMPCSEPPCTPPPPYCSSTMQGMCPVDQHDCYLACG